MARFSVIPAAAVIDSRLSLRELSVLCAIGIHTDRNGWCYPSSERLGEMLGVSGGMVRQSVAALAKHGYVQIVGRRRDDGGQTSNAIRVMMDAQHPSDAMRFSLDPSDPSRTPVSSELTPPVSLEITPPVSSGLTRKPQVKSPNEQKSIGAEAPSYRGTRISPSWGPSPDLIEFAFGRGFSAESLREEVNRFKDYWIAQPGQKGLKLDWPATFRNWIRNAKPSSGIQYGSSNAAGRQTSLVERVAANAQRIIAAERAANGFDDGDTMASHGADLRAPLDGTAWRVP